MTAARVVMQLLGLQILGKGFMLWVWGYMHGLLTFTSLSQRMEHRAVLMTLSSWSKQSRDSASQLTTSLLCSKVHQLQTVPVARLLQTAL